MENPNYKFYILITHEYINSKNIKEYQTIKTKKINLLAYEMNLDHEIIFFQDIDLSSSKIYMRMMLRGEKKIKKYKNICLNFKELKKNIKEKKIMNFPFNSKLIFNYNLTNNKGILSNLKKDTKLNLEAKINKSNLESINDEDEKCEEESEDSSRANDDNNNGLKAIKSSNNKNIENKNDNFSVKTMTFRQRLNMFEEKEKKENPMKNNTIKSDNKIVNKFKEGGEKSKEFLLKVQKVNENIKRTQTIKMVNNPNMPINKKNQIINFTKIQTYTNQTINENEEIKINNKTSFDKNKNINKIEAKFIMNNKNSNEINNTNNQKIVSEPKKNTIIQKSNVLKPKINENKNNDDFNKNKININTNKANNSGQILSPIKIDISKEKNYESFCSSFFLCSFPYKNGKIMQNSKDYRSTCNHPICSKLISMESEIIYRYPPNDIDDLELNKLSASICFPTGIKICYTLDNRSTYKSFSTHFISEKGQKFYMVIYHFFRKLDSMTYNQLYFDNPLKLYLRQFGENSFCNNMEKEKLESDLMECQELGFREFVFIPYAIVLISKFPYINQMRTCLNIIYRMLSNDDNIIDNLMSNNQIDLLEKFLSYIIYSIPTPIINSEIIFNIPLTSEKIKILSPYKDKIRDLQIINFPYILSKFSVDNIIKIYKLMLFEQKILFIDTIYYNISTVINSFTNILYPIDWINTIIPIMSSPMVCYLQTFLPFINGISQDLFEKNAKHTLDEAEEGVFEIFIYNNTIKYSKPDYEEDVLSSIPKLPDDIYKKLSSELKDLSWTYKNLNENEKEKYSENINNIAKNIFFESTCIMLYDLLDFVLDDEKEFNGFSNSILINIYQKEAYFYKELTEAQIFQTFMNNFTKRKKDYTPFIRMMKNITEKYVKTDLNCVKGKERWKKIIRKITKKEVLNLPITFKIPHHLLNSEEITSYTINNKEWDEINNEFIQKQNGNKEVLINKIIVESDRTTKIIEVKSLQKIIKQEKYRYVIPDEPNYQKKYSILNNQDIGINDESESLKEKLKNDLSSKINLLITNQKQNDNNFNLEEILNYLDYDIGTEILAKTLYKKGFRAALKLDEENYNSLNKICKKALISLNNSEENMFNLELIVKITSSAFYFSKENNNNFLIDDLRNDFNNNYYYWNKEPFWNTWQFMQDYFSINDYNTYCRIIIYDFSNKLLRLKLDKNFIINYLISILGEKIILMEYNNDLTQERIQENQKIFSETRDVIIEIVNSYPY